MANLKKKIGWPSRAWHVPSTARSGQTMLTARAIPTRARPESKTRVVPSTCRAHAGPGMPNGPSSPVATPKCEVSPERSSIHSEFSLERFLTWGEHDRRLRWFHPTWTEIDWKKFSMVIRIFYSRIRLKNSDFWPIDQLNIQKRTPLNSTEIGQSSIGKKFRQWLEPSTLESNQKTSISDRSTDWTSLVLTEFRD